MVKTHEVNLDTAEFAQFTNSDYLIMKIGDISVNDYVLFKEVKTQLEVSGISGALDSVTIETGLFRMTSIRQIIKSEGLKDGYALVIVNKL